MPPSMWRVELLHPLVVHFAVALLVVAAVLRLCLWQPFLLACSRLLTAVGVVFAWASYLTGTWAEEEVNSVLCDPTMTHLHGDYALYTSWIFSVVALFDLLFFLKARFPSLGWSAAPWLRHLLLAASSCGALLMGYVGHLGATLTYQQGAGVYHPTPECKEFE